MRNRLAEFDIAKGIAAYLVVLGHLLGQVAGKNIALITFCHMPVFFWISGFFLQKSFNSLGGGQGYRQIIVKKIYRLLIPYLIWSAISLAANISIKVLHGNILWPDVWEEFTAIFVYARSVWFLIIMFLSEVLCSVVWKCITKERNRYLTIVSIWLMICVSPVQELFSLRQFKWLFPFFILGMWCEKYSVYDNLKKRIVLTLTGFIYIPMGYILFHEGYFTEYITFTYSSVKSVWMGVLYYVVSLMAVVAVILISGYLAAITVGKYVAVIGRYSMEVYVMHMLMVKFLLVVPEFIWENNLYIYLYFGIYGMGVTVLCVVFSKYFLEKFKVGCWMMGRSSECNG